MANLFARTYTFTDGTTAYGSQVETEIGNIVNVLNNLNTATSTWGQLSSLHATSVPLIADCGAGSQDIADFKNNSVIKASIGSGGQLTLKPTTNQIVLGTTNTVTISATAPASSRTYTMPDVGAAGTFAFLEKAQTFTAQQTLSAAAGNIISGTNTNDSAGSGYVGEAIRTFNSPPNNFPATTVWGDGTSISLTAGDWDVSAVINVDFKGTTTTLVEFGISVTTGNSATGLSLGDNMFPISAPVGTASQLGFGCIAGYRVSISSTTIHYLKIMATFSGTTPQYGCRLSARRVR